MKLLTGILFVALSFNVSAIEVGDTAPCVDLNTITGGVGSEAVEQCLTAKEEGVEFAILEFMSINCGACLKNLPKISDLSLEIEQFATTKMISIDRNLEAVNDFLNANESMINFNFAFDNERLAKTAYSIRYTPTMFIVNGDGEVVYKHIGTLTDEHLSEIKEIVGAE